MKDVAKLSVIEIPYGDLNWGPDPKHIRSGIYSDIQYWDKYRELDDYHLCGVYSRIHAPYEISRIAYEPKEQEEIWLTLTRQVSDAACAALQQGNALLLTGGYCKDAVGVCGGIQRAIGAEKKVGIIYLDAHSDMATPETTHTGILGGMDLAVVLGVGLPQWREAAGLKVPFCDTNVILSDFRTADIDDDGSLEIINRLHIQKVDTKTFNDAQVWGKIISDFAEKVDAIYLHIDGDWLNSRYVPNAACVSEDGGGPTVFEGMRGIRQIMDTGKVLVYGSYGYYFDYGYDDPRQDSLTLSGMRLVSAGLSSWKKMPSFD